MVPGWVRAGAWVLLFAAVAAAAVSWFTPTPELRADDARRLVGDALVAAEVDAAPAGAPRAAEHRTEGGEDVPVWVVDARAETDAGTETIELRVQRSAGRLVYIDDRIGPDDAEQLLTEEQFAVLGDHRDDSRANRWALRNGLGAVSALVIAGACYLLAIRPELLRSSR